MSRILPAAVLFLALLPALAFASDVADQQCVAPNANQTYSSKASCGETVDGKTNLFGCPCSDSDVKGSCQAQNVCKAQTCLIDGSWQTCPASPQSPSQSSTQSGATTPNANAVVSQDFQAVNGGQAQTPSTVVQQGFQNLPQTGTSNSPQVSVPPAWLQSVGGDGQQTGTLQYANQSVLSQALNSLEGNPLENPNGSGATQVPTTPEGYLQNTFDTGPNGNYSPSSFTNADTAVSQSGVVVTQNPDGSFTLERGASMSSSDWLQQVNTLTQNLSDGGCPTTNCIVVNTGDRAVLYTTDGTGPAPGTYLIQSNGPLATNLWSTVVGVDPQTISSSLQTGIPVSTPQGAVSLQFAPNVADSAGQALATDYNNSSLTDRIGAYINGNSTGFAVSYVTPGATTPETPSPTPQEQPIMAETIPADQVPGLTSSDQVADMTSPFPQQATPGEAVAQESPPVAGSGQPEQSSAQTQESGPQAPQSSGAESLTQPAASAANPNPQAGGSQQPAANNAGQNVGATGGNPTNQGGVAVQNNGTNFGNAVSSLLGGMLGGLLGSFAAAPAAPPIVYSATAPIVALPATEEGLLGPCQTVNTQTGTQQQQQPCGATTNVPQPQLVATLPTPTQPPQVTTNNGLSSNSNTSASQPGSSGNAQPQSNSGNTTQSGPVTVIAPQNGNGNGTPVNPTGTQQGPTGTPNPSGSQQGGTGAPATVAGNGSSQTTPTQTQTSGSAPTSQSQPTPASQLSSQSGSGLSAGTGNGTGGSGNGTGSGVGNGSQPGFQTATTPNPTQTTGCQSIACQVGQAAQKALQWVATNFNPISPAEAQPYNPQSGQPLADAVNSACKIVGCNAPLIQKAMGGVCAIESVCDASQQHPGSQYQGFGQLGSAETQRAINELYQMAQSPKLSSGEQAEVLSAANAAKSYPGNPNANPVLGPWLLVGLHVALGTLPKVSAITNDPVTAAAYLENAQLAPATFSGSFQPSTVLCSACVKAYNDQHWMGWFGPNTTVGQAAQTMVSIVGPKINRGIAYSSQYSPTASPAPILTSYIFASNSSATTPTQAPFGGYKGTKGTPTIQPGNPGYVPGTTRIASIPQTTGSVPGLQSGAVASPDLTTLQSNLGSAKTTVSGPIQTGLTAFQQTVAARSQPNSTQQAAIAAGLSGLDSLKANLSAMAQSPIVSDADKSKLQSLVSAISAYNTQVNSIQQQPVVGYSQTQGVYSPRLQAANAAVTAGNALLAQTQSTLQSVTSDEQQAVAAANQAAGASGQQQSQGMYYQDAQTGITGQCDSGMSQADCTKAASQDVAIERAAQALQQQGATLPQGAQFQTFNATLTTSAPVNAGTQAGAAQLAGELAAGTGIPLSQAQGIVSSNPQGALGAINAISTGNNVGTSLTAIGLDQNTQTNQQALQTAMSQNNGISNTAGVTNSTYTIKNQNGDTVATGVSLPAGSVGPDGTVQLLSDAQGNPLGQDGKTLQNNAPPLSAGLPQPTVDANNPTQLDFADTRPAQPPPAQVPPAQQFRQQTSVPLLTTSPVGGLGGIPSAFAQPPYQTTPQPIQQPLPQPALSTTSTSTTTATSTPAVVSISASPASVARGGQATLSWSSSGTTGCEITMTGGLQIGATTTSGSVSSGPLATSTVFGALCTTSGNATVAATTSVLVR